MNYKYLARHFVWAAAIFFTLILLGMAVLLALNTPAGAQSPATVCEFEQIDYLGREQVFTAQPGHELLVESNDLGLYAWDVVTTTVAATNSPLDVYERPAGGRPLTASEYRSTMQPLTETVETLGTFDSGVTVCAQVIDNSGNQTSRGNLRIFNGQVLFAQDTSPRVVNFEYFLSEAATIHLAHQDTIAFFAWSIASEATVTPTAEPTPTDTPTPTNTASSTPTETSTPVTPTATVLIPTDTAEPPTPTPTPTATDTPMTPEAGTVLPPTPTATPTPNCVDGQPRPQDCPSALPTMETQPGLYGIYMPVTWHKANPTATPTHTPRGN